MREPISLSSEVFVARNLRQNLLRFFWPEPARPAQKRVTADGTLPGAACKGGDCGAMAVRERIRRSFAGQYSCSGLRPSLGTERGTCRKFHDPFTEAYNARCFGPRIGLMQA